MGSVWCICARGTCAGPSRCWSGPWGCARTGTFRSSLPRQAASPGPGVCPGWACRRGSGAGGTRGGATGRQGQTEVSGALWSPGSARRICWRVAWKRRSTRAAQAVELARQYQQRGNQAWALWLLGESTARQASPEVEPAAGHYRQALALAEELGMRPLQAHCHRGLGMLYATTGQREQARAALSTAIEMYRAYGR